MQGQTGATLIAGQQNLQVGQNSVKHLAASKRHFVRPNHHPLLQLVAK